LSRKQRQHAQHTRQAAAFAKAQADMAAAPAHERFNTMPLKKGLLGCLILLAFICVGLNWHLDAQIQALLVKGGFVPFPGPADGDSPLYWVDKPGHLLRIVTVPNSEIGAACILLGFASFMALLGWWQRETFLPYLVVILGSGFCILVSGAFFARVQSPLDFSINEDAGVAASYTPIASLSDIAGVTIDERTGARSSPSYWLVAHLKSGGTADLTVFDTRVAAAAVLARVLPAIASAQR
jgi:hypothetical protein